MMAANCKNGNALGQVLHRFCCTASLSAASCGRIVGWLQGKSLLTHFFEGAFELETIFEQR